MKALVYFCRWRGAKLRLRGRDETAVWGELVYGSENETSTAETFHFDLRQNQIRLQTSEGEQLLQLDEMGVVQENRRD